MDAHDPAGNPPAKLKRRAQLFVSEYLKDLNGTAAAIRAGYSPATARAAASRMLTNVNISAAVREAQNEILKENHVTVSRIVRELSLIAFFDPASLFDESGRLLPINMLPREIRHALPAIEIAESANGARRLRFGGKLAALLALARHMSMFKDRMGGDPDFDDLFEDNDGNEYHEAKEESDFDDEYEAGDNEQNSTRAGGHKKRLVGVLN